MQDHRANAKSNSTSTIIMNLPGQHWQVLRNCRISNSEPNQPALAVSLVLGQEQSLAPCKSMCFHLPAKLGSEPSKPARPSDINLLPGHPRNWTSQLMTANIKAQQSHLPLIPDWSHRHEVKDTEFTVAGRWIESCPFSSFGIVTC